jgi:hypothetical protein
LNFFAIAFKMSILTLVARVTQLVIYALPKS